MGIVWITLKDISSWTVQRIVAAEMKSVVAWLALKRYQFEAITSIIMLEPSEKQWLCILCMYVPRCT